MRTPCFINSSALIADTWVWFCDVHSSHGACSILTSLHRVKRQELLNTSTCSASLLGTFSSKYAMKYLDNYCLLCKEFIIITRLLTRMFLFWKHFPWISNLSTLLWDNLNVSRSLVDKTSPWPAPGHPTDDPSRVYCNNFLVGPSTSTLSPYRWLVSISQILNVIWQHSSAVCTRPGTASGHCNHHGLIPQARGSWTSCRDIKTGDFFHDPLLISCKQKFFKNQKHRMLRLKQIDQ